MIRNDNQLRSAKKSLKEIVRGIKKIREDHFSDKLLDLFIIPLLDHKFQIEDEINTFVFLRDSPFEEGIKYLSENPGIIENIGELLTMLRIAAKVTQSELAENLGWSQSNISRFESENYSSQTIKKIVEYSSKLGVWLNISPSLSEKLISAPSIKKFNTMITSAVTWGESISEKLISTDSTEKDWQNILKVEVV